MINYVKAKNGSPAIIVHPFSKRGLIQKEILKIELFIEEEI